MFKRILLSLIIIPIVGILIYGYLHLRENTASNKDAFLVVPENPVVIIEWHGLDQCVKSSSKTDTSISNHFFQQDYFSSCQKFLQKLKLNLSAEPSLLTAFSGNNTYSAIYEISKNKYQWFFCTSIPKEIDNSVLLKVIEKLGTKDWKIIKHASYFELEIKSKPELYFYFTNGIFAASKSSLLLNNSMLRMVEKNPEMKNKQYSDLMKLSSTSSELSIYANSKSLIKIFSELYGYSFYKQKESNKNASLFSADVNITADYLFANGIVSSATKSKYNKPSSFDMAKVIPANFSMLEWFNSIDENINVTDSTDRNLGKCFDNEMAVVTYQALNENSEINTFQILELKEKLDFVQYINSIDSTDKITLNIDSSFNFNTRKIKRFLNQKYLNGKEVFCKQIDNYLIVANSNSSLIKVEEQILVKNTLDKYIEFIRSSEVTFSKANSIILIHPKYYSSQLLNTLNTDGKNLIADNKTWLSKISLLSYSLSNNGKSELINYFVSYRNTNHYQLNKAWIKQIESKSSEKPLKLYSKEDSVSTFVVRSGSALEFLSLRGKLITKTNIQDSIIGNLKVIKSRKSKNEYCIFNTPSKIYMYNALGIMQSGFPIRLESNANTSLEISYNQDAEPRITLSCLNKKIYQYNASGKLVDSWKSPTIKELSKTNILKSNSNEKPIYFGFDNNDQFFRINEKGKLIKAKDSIALKIGGIKKILPVGNFTSIVLANNLLHVVNLKDGTSNETIPIGAKVFDICNDIDDELVFTILTDKGICKYDLSDKKVVWLIKRRMNSGIHSSEKLDGKKYIFYFDAVKHQTYCFDEKLVLKTGFPINSDNLPLLYKKYDNLGSSILINSFEQNIEAIYFQEK